MPTVNGPDEITDLEAGNDKVFYSDSSGDVTEVALGAAATVLTSAGATSAPTFAVIPADATVGANKAMYSDSGDTVAGVAFGAAGTVLTSGGTTAAPTFSALPADPTVGANKTMYTNNSDVESGLAFGAAGTVLKSGGTDATATPPTFGTITATDIDGGTWKVLYTDGSGNVTELALSATAGTVLTSNGAAIAPTFQTAGADFADENSVVSSEMFMDHPSTNPAAIAAGGSGYGQGVWTYQTSWYSY